MAEEKMKEKNNEAKPFNDLSYDERLALARKSYEQQVSFLKEKIEYHRSCSREKDRTGRSIWHHESLEEYYRSLLQIAEKEGPTCSKWISNYVVRAVK